MKVFLWILLVCYVIQTLWSIGYLCENDYPRTKIYDSVDDVFTLLFSLGFGGWIVFFLFF